MKAFSSLHAISSRYPWTALGVSAALLLGSAPAFAQPSPAIQTFSSTTPPASELLFTQTGSGGYFTVTAGGGTGAYGVKDGNNNGSPTLTTLDFGERTYATGSGTSTANQLSLELANPDGNFDTDSKVEIFLSVNRAGYPGTPQITISGPPSSTGPNYNFSGGDTKTFASSATSTAVVGSVAYPNPISKVIVTLPSSTTAGTRVSLRIRLTANDKTTLLTDNVTFTSGNASPLPVELSRFSAVAKAQGVGLEWATASEKNSASFEVQRSTTGELFQAIGSVQAQGYSSSGHTYAFADARPLAGRTYYRLRQVDTDGSSTFSPVATVQWQAEATVYPNPSTGTVVLPAMAGPVRYRVLNPMGQALLSGQASGNEKLDFTTLAKGTFFLELTSEGGRTTQRLVRE